MNDSKEGSEPLPRVRDAQVSASPEAKERTELVPLRGIRKTIAEHMKKSKEAVVQVTHFDEADLTDLVLLKEELRESAEKRSMKLTYLPFFVRALVPALKEFPFMNSSLDEKNGFILLKNYYNIGIATDTERGLIVPVVRNFDSMDIFQLAEEIDRVASRAKTGRLSLDEVGDSTFTVTNLEAIGGLFVTPVVNYPEVAILGVHRISKRPVIWEDRIAIRDMTYLSLSFDHRVIDGAYAARFMNRVIEALQDPKRLVDETH
jgi:pyruvate dehydrogenase E2 component (dihydrolipoamide acetyltransferase)